MLRLDEREKRVNTCNYCKSQIESKTKSGKIRKFCNRSCSRKHYIENNKEKVSESNKKGYQTLLQNKGEEFVKHRGRSTDNKRQVAKRLHESGHFHRMSKVGNEVLKQRGRTKDHVAKWRKTYEDNGHTLSVEDTVSWKQYNRKARRLTLQLYGSAGEGLEWDHIVPLIFGYKNNISIDQICEETNITKMTIHENRKKGHKLTKDSYRVLGEWGWEEESHSMCGLDEKGCAA